MNMPLAITQKTIETAHDRIRPYVHRTPILTSASLDTATGAKLYFKCENFQKAGAFKARGATNAVLSLSEEQRQGGLATHSSGNHAQALSRAAALVQADCFVVMPSNAPEIKKKAVRAYGGKIFECEPNINAREKTLAEVVQKTGATEIHPFNHYPVIAGQATAAKEIIEDMPQPDYVLAPVGGGGLLSGTALATAFFSPGLKVIGCEPAGADDAYKSLKSGKIEYVQPNTIADGLLTALGDKTFPIIQQHVKEIVTVSDEEIIAAMRLLAERLKVVVEPSAAVPFAVVRKEREKFEGKQVAIILSGGNLDWGRKF